MALDRFLFQFQFNFFLSINCHATHKSQPHRNLWVGALHYVCLFVPSSYYYVRDWRTQDFDSSTSFIERKEGRIPPPPSLSKICLLFSLFSFTSWELWFPFVGLRFPQPPPKLYVSYFSFNLKTRCSANPLSEGSSPGYLAAKLQTFLILRYYPAMPCSIHTYF